MAIVKARQHRELQPGDHIKVGRIGYVHHGIYCDHNTVVHYSDANYNKWGASIGEDSLDTFEHGGTIQVVAYKHPYPASFVMKRAQSRIGEHDYNLFFNNCEHFAKWCKTGQSKSVQANLAARVAVKVLLKYNPIAYLIAEGVQIIWSEILSPPDDRPQYEFLPLDILLLFQVFKLAYERKSIEMLSKTISEKFSSNVYGGTKRRFLQIMEGVFNATKYGLQPSLTINIYDIEKDDPKEFRAIIEMDANVNAFGVVDIPFTQYDSGRLVCVARPERHDWRIVELTKFDKD